MNHKHINDIESICHLYNISSEGIDHLIWEKVTKYCILSEEFIEKHIDQLNLKAVVKYQKLSKEFIIKHFNKLNLGYILQFQNLSEDLIYKLIFKIDNTSTIQLRAYYELICTYQKISEKFIEENCNGMWWRSIHWVIISSRQELSESFIEKHFSELSIHSISGCQRLSESFIERHIDNLDMYAICANQVLSEAFIERHANKVSWAHISMNQHLSESFINRHSDQVDWHNICRSQKLSESFIERNIRKIKWDYIAAYQKLSESFIDMYANKLDWKVIFVNQNLTTSFIEKHYERIKEHKYLSYISHDYLHNIVRYQKLPKEFLEKHNEEIVRLNIGVIHTSNWLYWTVEEKLNYIKTKTDYKVVNDKYIVAYKSTKSNGFSVYNFQNCYEVGGEYEAHCDCTCVYNSFGLSAWTKEGALEYHNKGKLFEVRINIEDIGVILIDGKIRCKRLTVVKEIEG